MLHYLTVNATIKHEQNQHKVKDRINVLMVLDEISTITNCRYRIQTFVGSMIPAATKSSYTPVAAL
jgi:hypothetical protein